MQIFTSYRIKDTIEKNCPKNTFLTLILTQKPIAEFFRQIAEFFLRNGGRVSSGAGNSVAELKSSGAAVSVRRKGLLLTLSQR